MCFTGDFWHHLRRSIELTSFSQLLSGCTSGKWCDGKTALKIHRGVLALGMLQMRTRGAGPPHDSNFQGGHCFFCSRDADQGCRTKQNRERPASPPPTSQLLRSVLAVLPGAEFKARALHTTTDLQVAILPASTGHFRNPFSTPLLFGAFFGVLGGGGKEGVRKG